MAITGVDQGKPSIMTTSYLIIMVLGNQILLCLDMTIVKLYACHQTNTLIALSVIHLPITVLIVGAETHFLAYKSRLVK